VRTITKERLAADGVAVDFISGGFPCQDISFAGRGAGLAGERSGLFYEVARLIGELEPAGVMLENVSALLDRGLGDVLGALASLGYDAEWHCIPASAIGAPHRRDRIWIVANPVSGGIRRGHHDCSGPAGASESEGHQRQRVRPDAEPSRQGVADTDGPRLEGWLRLGLQECARKWASGQGGSCELGGTWIAEPAVGRVADGVPGRVDRLKQLGNAVVPQIPELIGRAILASLSEQRSEAA
jgi:DNA (cytosine-5)-methyltransferase 1